MSYPPLSAQLIVFSRQMDLERDTEAVLDAVQAAGFGAIECGAGMRAQDPEVFKAMLDRRSLKVSGVHGGVSVDLDATFRLMDLYQTRDLCVSGAGGWEGRSAERYLKDVETLNQMGRACAQHGFYLHYHNHAYEFAATDGDLSGMGLILSNLDHQAADLCVDVAWVHLGGEDPCIFLRKNAERIGYVHLKDYVGDRHWVELGQGVMRLDCVMQALATLKRVRWVAYEQDTSDRTAAESCAISHKYLVDTFGYG
jgi:sugar phosphate isomerase/epimerase